MIATRISGLPGKVKLFKLLYLLDFEHFRQTGRSVTGLDYRAWELGPIPIRLMQEWEDLKPDLANAISIQPEKIIDYIRETVAPRAEFDDSHFSKRELRILVDLAEKYRDTYSPEMIDVTHAENGAWAKVWNDGQGFDHPIDYTLAVSDDDPNREAILKPPKNMRLWSARKAADYATRSTLSNVLTAHARPNLPACPVLPECARLADQILAVARRYTRWLCDFPAAH